MTDLPDRLSVDPDSPFHDADLLAKGIGVRFKGEEKTNVEEYCISAASSVRLSRVWGYSQRLWGSLLALARMHRREAYRYLTQHRSPFSNLASRPPPRPSCGSSVRRR